jgi:hypothetical protein
MARCEIVGTIPNRVGTVFTLAGSRVLWSCEAAECPGRVEKLLILNRARSLQVMKHHCSADNVSAPVEAVLQSHGRSAVHVPQITRIDHARSPLPAPGERCLSAMLVGGHPEPTSFSRTAIFLGLGHRL